MNSYKLCIFGNPIQHSISPELHQGFAKQCGLNISYVKIEPALPDFEKAVLDFMRAGGHGANITSPFKERAFAMCDDVSERAAIAQSVNTFVFKDGKIFGDNTDGIGLIRDIKHNLQYDLKNKTIIILGAGGATRGILHPLLNENPKNIFIYNRTFEKAKQLAQQFSVHAIKTLENQQADVVINALPFDATILMDPRDKPEADEKSFQFTNDSLYYDLKYNQPLIQNHATHQADGKGMVIEQGREAFWVWTGVLPKRPLI